MYNPSEAGKKGTIFGLPYAVEEADIVLLPVHLDATVSYSDGTAKAPSQILEESSQIDLSLLGIDKPWGLKMAMHKKIVKKSHNEIHRGRAKNVIKAIESGKKVDTGEIQFVNEFCSRVHKEVEELSGQYLDANRIVGVVGGDHSSPLGLITALAARYEFGILQVDAHMDLRKSYEGFEYSHASIMYNALKLKSVSKLVQVGIRDFCEEEWEFSEINRARITTFYDQELYRERLCGVNWLDQSQSIISELPDRVYISFDVDGLHPSLCPNTGTPVPGGLYFNEIALLLDELVKSGKQIIGFDICETAPKTWDANVASRILYRLAVSTGLANGLLQFRE